MNDEGYIKYQAHWSKKAIEVPEAELLEINQYRSQLIALSMIGKIPDGPSFGNISVRDSGNQFFISGSDTGMLQTLNPEHLARVKSCQIAQNQIAFEGLIAASSESMTHAAVYEKNPSVHAVIHIHNAKLWKQWLFKLPTTSSEISYGTPEMALALQDLVGLETNSGTIVLGGHEDGLISYGENLQSAFQELMRIIP